jgi:hypothetical protein
MNNIITRFVFSGAVLISSAHLNAAVLQGDYQFQNSLAPSLGAMGSLNYLGGTTAYINDVVDGQNRLVLSVPTGGGPQAVLDGFVSSTNYSMVLLASLNVNVAVATKLLDFKNLTSDSGVYVNGGFLDFFDASGATLIPPGAGVAVTNGYEQIVLTRDGITDLTTAYVNGLQAFSFVDSSGLAIITSTNSPGSLLSFFKDDSAGLGIPEDSSGNIARLRLYDGALTGEEVGLLDRITPVPEPGSLAMLFIGSGLLGARFLRARTSHHG